MKTLDWFIVLNKPTDFINACAGLLLSHSANYEQKKQKQTQQSRAVHAKMRMNMNMNMNILKVKKQQTIVVGISVNAARSAELLSWAIGVAATAGDTVIALHVAATEERKLGDFVQPLKSRIERANAFAIDLLGTFTDLCHAKQVRAEAKVSVASSIEKGLIDHVSALAASFLILGDSPSDIKRSGIGVAKYCLDHSPAECSVIVLKYGRLAQQAEDNSRLLENTNVSNEGLHRLPLKWSGREVAKHIVSFQKRFISKLSSGNEEIIIQVDNKLSGPSHSVAKMGLLGHKLAVSDDEVDSKYNNQNCLNILRNFNFTLPTLIPSSFGRRSMHYVARENEEKDKNTRNGKCITPVSKPSWRCFTFTEIAKATSSFHPENLVGKGGYAEVYRGTLDDGQIVAVKRLANENTDEEKEKDFLTELGVIGHVCHPNAASLIGCCIENGLYLIFPFSTHGSLATALHGTDTQLLTWPIRYKIAVGTARGLHYLHKCCQRRIIHRDIKSSNVLLGPDFEPQISDFGLAKWLPRQWTHHSITPVEGTFGYLAPEYFLHGIVDEKTDVYAFGMLLLEIISGKKPCDISEQNILLWAKPLMESENFLELADPRLEGRYDLHQMQRMVLTASLCVRQSALWRPSMSEVLQLLTDSQSPESLESWRMPDSKKDEVDDYFEFGEHEYSQRFSCASTSP